jgi:hypothetical protein
MSGSSRSMVGLFLLAISGLDAKLVPFNFLDDPETVGSSLSRTAVRQSHSYLGRGFPAAKPRSRCRWIPFAR